MISHTIASKGFARAALTVLASGLVGATASVANAARDEVPHLRETEEDMNCIPLRSPGPSVIL